MMMRTLLASLIAFTLLACGGPESDLEGSWEVDEATFDDVPAEMRGFAKGMAKQMGGLKFEDGKMSMGGQTYGYEVVKTDGDKITLKATDGMLKGTEIVLEVHGDKLVMPNKGKSVTYKRVD